MKLSSSYLVVREALESGDFQGIPLMTGTCRDEGLLILSHILKEPARWDT